MDKLEKKLEEEKNRLDRVVAPEELEMRLRSALQTIPSKKIKRTLSVWKLAAVALFFIVTIGYQYNAFSFYSKKLLGFDELMHGTLQELNDEGMGQIVEKGIQLQDGTDFMIDGIMTDDNQLIMYYTLTNPNGIEDQNITFSGITGFLTNSMAVGGTGIINEDHTERKGMMSFEPVSPFLKKITLHFWQPHENDQSITFPYNPNKAMQTMIKQSIKKTLAVDQGNITFNSITASPTMTVIEGTLNVEDFDRINLAFGGMELMANGKPINLMGSGSQSALRGTKFEIRYDVLPKQLHSLELVMKEFVGYQLLDEKLSLASIDNEPINLDGKELLVKDVSTTSGGVEITIATEDDVMLDGVSIETNDGVIPLKTTVDQHYPKQADGRVLKERTLLFDTIIAPKHLIIEGMHYTKAYYNVIEIPVD